MKISKFLSIVSFILIIDASKNNRRNKKNKKENNVSQSQKNANRIATIALMIGLPILLLNKFYPVERVAPEIISKKFEYENHENANVSKEKDDKDSIMLDDDSVKTIKGFGVLKERENVKLEMKYDISREIMENELTELAGIQVSSLSEDQMMEYCRKMIPKLIESYSIYSDPMDLIRDRISRKSNGKFQCLSDLEMEANRRLFGRVGLWGNFYYAPEAYWYRSERVIRDCNLIFTTLKLDPQKEMLKMIF